MDMLNRDYIRRQGEGPPTPAGFLASRWLWGGLAALIGIVVIVGVILHGGTPAEQSRLVNINTASPSELESLPGIGPSLARLIIADRPYRQVAEIERVKGIGPRQVEQLRPFLTASDGSGSTHDTPFWERFHGGSVALSGMVVTIVGFGLIAGLYGLYRWVRQRLQKGTLSRAQALFDEAERRRWEGHRREKTGGARKD